MGKQIRRHETRLLVLLRMWSEKLLLLVLVVAAGAFTLALSRGHQPSRSNERGDQAGLGVIDRRETLDLWLQDKLARLIVGQSAKGTAGMRDDWRPILESNGLTSTWYAITIRGHQQDGNTADITFIRHPYREPENDREFQDVVATLAGDPPSDPVRDFSRAKIHFLPPELMNHDPRQVLEALLSVPRQAGENSQ